MDMDRRQFFRVSGAGLAGSSLVALGFSPTAALAETRQFKLARTTETRNTRPLHNPPEAQQTMFQ